MYFTCSKASAFPWEYSWRQPRAMTSEAPGAPRATVVTSHFGNHLPSRPLIAAPANGRIGMSQRSWRNMSALPAHQDHAVDVDGAPLADAADEEREPHRGLGGGHRHHEEDDHLTGVRPELAR